MLKYDVTTRTETLKEWWDLMKWKYSEQFERNDRQKRKDKEVHDGQDHDVFERQDWTNEPRTVSKM